MRNRPQRRSSIFLMEIILAIFFFSIAAAVCIRFFAAAKLKSDDAATLQQAVLAASGAAEVLEVCDGTTDSLLTYYPEAEADGQTVHVCYDEDWILCSTDTAAFLMDVQLSDDNGLLSASIVVTDTDGEEIYTLDTAWYRQADS